jgi:flagellar hook-length control protein FliK
MQSIMPIYQQIPAREALDIQSLDKPDESSANAFRSQIGRILNQKDGNGSNRAGAKTEDFATAAFHNPQRMRLNVSTPSGKSIKRDAKPDSKEPDSKVPERQNIDGAQLNDISQAAPPAPSTESILQPGAGIAPGNIASAINPEAAGKDNTKIEIDPIAADAANAQNNALALVENKNSQRKPDGVLPDASVPPATPPEFSKESKLQPGSHDASQKIELAASFEMSPNLKAQLKKAPTVIPILKTQNGVNTLPEEKKPQSGPGSAPPAALVNPAQFPKSVESGGIKSGFDSELPRIDDNEKLEISPNDNTLMENASSGASAGKAPDAAMMALESMSLGEFHTEQNASHNMPIPGIAAQSKPENAAQNSGKISTTENPPEIFSASPFSSPVPGGESRNGVGSASERIPAAQPKEFTLQVAQRIQFQIREGKETVRIQLKPDSLGRIEIRAETTGNGVIARIATESPMVKSYLENNMHMLQQTLQDQGLKADRIDIVVHDSLDFSAFSGYGAQFGHTGTGHAGNESHVFHESSGHMASEPLEEISLDPRSLAALNPDIHFYAIA